MKAVRYHEFGDANVMHYEDVERPHPEAGEVLIEVAATSFNQVDIGIRGGYMKEIFPVDLPHTPGIDVAGTIAELGDDVSAFSIGDAVVGFLPFSAQGAAAEYVVASADTLTAAPNSIPLADAAAFPAVGVSAWQALFEHADVRSGQRVLINGASGGVGGYAVQLAKQAGAFVIATASPQSTEIVRADGADEVIDYTQHKVTDALTEPVDVVINLVSTSKEEMAALIDLVRPDGVLVSTTPGAEDSRDEVRAIDMNLHQDVDELAGLVSRLDAGELHVNITRSYPMSDIVHVHQQAEESEQHGKIILTPA